MALDWIPANEYAFGKLATQLSGRVSEATADYGLTTEQADDLAAAVAVWSAASEADKDARAAAAAAIAARRTAREALVPLLRATGGIIQANPAVTDPNRERAGLSVYKTTRTPAPLPGTEPILRVTVAGPLEHAVRWWNSGGKKARPRGVAGLALYVRIGTTPPTGIEDCRLLGMIPRGPYHAHYKGVEAGQTAYFIARWVNTRGRPGPMSEVVAATIPGMV